MNKYSKNLVLWIIIALLLVALFNLFQSSSSRAPKLALPFSDFITRVENQSVREVTIQGSNITGVSTGAEETGKAANQVLESAGQLSRQSEELRGAVDKFLADIKAA